MTTTFSHTQLFRSNVLRSIPRKNLTDSAAQAPEQAADDGLEPVSLKSLFEHRVLQDAGASIHVKNLLGGIKFHEDVKEWIEAGGSPLMATRHATRNASEEISLLCYRQSISQSKALHGILKLRLHTPIKLEQWLLGTDPEMVVASLVKGLLAGAYRFSSFGKTVPMVLVDYLNDPSIKLQLGAFLRALPANKKTFYSDVNFASMAYAFSRLGHPELVEAIQGSPRYEAFRKFPQTAAQGLIADAFQEGVNGVEMALDFSRSFFEIDKLNVLIDAQLMESAQYLSDQMRSVALPIFIARFKILSDAGKLKQAVGWLDIILPTANYFPRVPEDQKAAFIGDLQSLFRSNKKMIMGMGLKAHGKTLAWLIYSIGKQAVLDEYRGACLDSALAGFQEYGPGRRVVGKTLLEFDQTLLSQNELLHPLLQVLHDIYPKIWASRPGEKRSRIETEQIVKLADWVGAALTVSPSVAVGAKWLAILDEPAARKALLVSMPMTKERLKTLGNGDRAIRFTHDLGM